MFWKNDNSKTFKKRQWGTEKNTAPLSILHEKPSTRKLTWSRVAIVLTVVFWCIYIFSIIIRQLIDGPQNYTFTMEAFSYSFVVSLLTFSSLMYLIARQGALERFSKHIRTPRALLDKYFSENQPGVTVLVPSYNEEYPVIRKTLLSAALQEYPKMRIVLLIDDKPNPTNPLDLDRLEKTRAIGESIQSTLTEPYERFKNALEKFNRLNSEKRSVTPANVLKLAGDYEWAAKWLNKLADKEEVGDHVDDFFANQVIRALSNDLSEVADALTLSAKEGEKLPGKRVRELYQRLVWTFRSKVEVFERKKYANLSHEPNKAMNLNSYIGLMGSNYREERTEAGLILTPTKKKNKDNISIPDTEFVLTLDADSILLREYCLRLVYYMQEPGHERVAVSQTPYSSFRGAYTRIEYLAGATTDIQHILHQGMTRYNATFWVGANAVIRKKALEDIAEKELVDGVEVKRYIQDRTVIEDTESSIDLGVYGWTLKNYPERLSYSATPPDFGSLVVQRRRWANGGLIILAKFWSQLKSRKARNELISQNEVLLRINYMASIAWATFGLMFLLAYPYDGRLLSPLVLLAALPYFISMAQDLKYCGYRYSDIFRIYGFNLIMLPVNLAGVLKSIEQAITGKKIPFARTPKIKDRTATSIQFVVVPLLIVAFSAFTIWRNILIENWGNAAFAGFNTAASLYAIAAYIGIRNIIADTWFGLTDWMYVEVKTKKELKPKSEDAGVNWKAILDQGNSKPLSFRGEAVA